MSLASDYVSRRATAVKTTKAIDAEAPTFLSASKGLQASIEVDGSLLIETLYTCDPELRGQANCAIRLRQSNSELLAMCRWIIDTCGEGEEKKNP